MYLRILATAVLAVVCLVQEKYLKFLVRPEIQLVIATLILATLVLYDAYVGVILGIALIVAYYRVFLGHFKGDKNALNNGDLRSQGPMVNLVSNYITEQNLEDAQSNKVADEDVEIKGVAGVYGEPVYGAQGLDKTMPGYFKEASLTGSTL